MGSHLDVAFVAPLRRELTVDGRLVVVQTADLDRILQLIEQTAPMHDELAQAPAAVVAAFSGEDLDTAQKIALASWLLGLVARHGQAVRNIVAICADLTPADVGAMLPDRVTALLLLSLEVNLDFFSRMVPMLQRLEQNLGLAERVQAQRSTGLPPSSS